MPLKTCAIIPAYNEERYISEVIRKAKKYVDSVFPVTVFEASAYGVPVVITVNCGIAEFIDGMAGYVANSSLPKIVEPLDINYKNWLHYSIKKSGFPIKIYWLIRFLQTMYREIYIYKKFDYCVVVTENDKKSIDRYLQNVIVIPNGVDIDYFKPIDIEDDYPSLIFTGAMNGGKI